MSKSFFTQTSYNFADLKFLIENEIEESLNLDYKASKSLDRTDRKKFDISKDISAFANSDGGIIIYGINEENHLPKEISYVDGEKFNKEWIENIIDSNIKPRVSGIKIFPVRIDSDIKKTVYIVKIPSSNGAPHMASDKKYYRRFNFKSVPMEEYEVKQLYNRKNKSEVIFKYCWSLSKPNEILENHNSVIREVSIHIENISNAIEKNCKVEIFFTFKNCSYIITGFRYNRNHNINRKIMKIKGITRPVITAFNLSPIFPKEEYNILDFTLFIKEEEYDDFWENGIMNINLYSSNAVKKYEREIKKLFLREE